MMLFRVSEADQFRQYRDDEEYELETLITRLRGHEPPSQKMAAGTAFHSVLEHAAGGEITEAHANGFHFLIEVDIEISLPAIRELRAHKDYPGIRITGQVDALEAFRIDDHKTTERFDPERYLDGYQWRFYLDIFEARVFRWNVFEMREVEPMTYCVHGFHQLEQRWYPGLPRDCEKLATDLADFSLIYMPERLMQEVA